MHIVCVAINTPGHETKYPSISLSVYLSIRYYKLMSASSLAFWGSSHFCSILFLFLKLFLYLVFVFSLCIESAFLFTVWWTGANHLLVVFCTSECEWWSCVCVGVWQSRWCLCWFPLKIIRLTGVLKAHKTLARTSFQRWRTTFAKLLIKRHLTSEEL